MTGRRPPCITGPHFAIIHLRDGVRFVGVDKSVAFDFLQEAARSHLEQEGPPFPWKSPDDIPEDARFTVEVRWG